MISFYPLTLLSSRKVSLSVSCNIAKWLTFCLKNIAKINYEIKNWDFLEKTIKQNRVVIGCNHQSSWETFIFPMLLENLSIVIKKELLSVPIAGLYCRKLGCIPVDRSSPVLAIKSLIKYGKLAVETGNNILIFPNGTRSSSVQTDYKSGIFALYKTLNIPVIPASVNSGKFWPRRALLKFPGTITLVFHEPIQPGLDKSAFFEAFKNRMVE
ncbi:MAG: 1-acyl-sn-glycerol-3-phosphate acyltransferase [Holosporales bacterium]|jgi:1-acyl-sn-glycerol-3-phosphate acyltransferase|nr:1-acyl-sn-glycerol-3-phosphate acyltransferase [Holosporales bacterium]